MDPEVLRQLESLARLNLPADLVRELIEHDKWKTLENNRHQIELETLRLAQHRTLSNRQGVPASQFNLETSGNECTVQQEGLVAKSKVLRGAAGKAKELELEQFPLALVSLLVGIYWCGARLARWPSAADAKTSLSLVGDFERAVERYGAKQTLQAAEAVLKKLDSADGRIIQQQLDQLRQQEQAESASKFFSSPLFREFHKSYPHILPEVFEECYDKHGKNFVATAIFLLRKAFPSTPPPELSHIQGWNQRWQQHLPNYLQKWQNELRALETKTKFEQKKWQESIS